MALNSMARKVTKPLEATHAALIERLGAIVYRWAFVEWLEGDFLAHLLAGDQGRMHIVTKNVAGSTVTDWLRTLAPLEFRHPEMQNRLNELFNRITTARAERNAYVHGLWTAGSQAGTADVMTIKWERAEVMKRELVTEGDLDSLLTEIGEIYTELAWLGEQLGFHPLQRTTEDSIPPGTDV